MTETGAVCHVTVREWRTRKKTLDHYDNSLTSCLHWNVHQGYFSYNNIQILCYNKREKCVRVNVLCFWVCIHKWYCPVLQQWRWRDRDYSHDTPRHSTGDNTPDWLQDSEHKKKSLYINTYITGSTNSITIKGEVCNSCASSGSDYF